MTGVSFVVPVRNGATHLTDTLAAIASQGDGRPMEVIVVEDGSTDGSTELLERVAPNYGLRIVRGPGLGAAAAVNAGVRAALFPIICQVDQDVVLDHGWMSRLVRELDDPQVGAAQGYYATDPASGFFARVMGLDLEQRYAAAGRRIDHVCTGNTAYRSEALHHVGLLDETLGYGYDNDLSYRLQAAGYRLTICRAARSRHRWREGLGHYLLQQYGFGYGRMDLVARHPARCSGDVVSPAGMMAHPLVLGLAMLLAMAAAVSALSAGPAWGLLTLAGILVGILFAERLVAGVRAWRQFGDLTAVSFPAVHLARDLAWVAAGCVWLTRRVLRRPFNPAHSMRARSAAQ